MSSWNYYPENFSSYEEYVKYLKEKGLALETPPDMYNTMKNEEKAKSLWFNFCTEKSCDRHNNCKSCPKAKIHPQLIEMAKWKDEEFNKILLEIAIKEAKNEEEIRPILKRLKAIKP